MRADLTDDVGTARQRHRHQGARRRGQRAALSRRGWSLVAGGLTLAIAGRLSGIEELSILAAAAGVLVVVALGEVWVARAALEALDVSRALRPAKVHAGANSQVELVVTNRGQRRTPVLAVRDPFRSDDPEEEADHRLRAQRHPTPTRIARFLLAPLAPGETAEAVYQLPTLHRGIYRLGPLEVTVADAFDVASRSLTVAPATRLMVLPKIDPVAPLWALGQEHGARVHRISPLSLPSEDFYALRPYQIGDDLRRVHWPSTARSGEVMVRQYEQPWRERATVLLDTRATVHSHESLELAVSAAASILVACSQRGALIRLVTTQGYDSGAAGATHLEAAMEHLATLRSHRRDRLLEVLATLRRSPDDARVGMGAVAVVTAAAATADDLSRFATLSDRPHQVVVVMFDDPSTLASTPLPLTPHMMGPLSVVRVPAGTPFVEAWDRATARTYRARRHQGADWSQPSPGTTP